MTPIIKLGLALTAAMALSACSSDSDDSRLDELRIEAAEACFQADQQVKVHSADDNLEFVRTPDSCFDALDNFDFEPNYVELDGLRMHYVDEGPATGEVILLLHGQPSWSYLYRKMIPPLSEAGFRVIALDHIGMGRSDKPVDPTVHTHERHVQWLKDFIVALELADISLFVQDWGSLIGLRVAGDMPEYFARIVVANGDLPVIPDGLNPFVAPSFEIDESLPASALEFFANRTGGRIQAFQQWIDYAAGVPDLIAADVVELATVGELSEAEHASYNAPFPSLIYKAAIRAFPSMVSGIDSRTHPAWHALGEFEKPFLFLAGENDPNLGSVSNQQKWIQHVPGAAGQHHARLEAGHFIQDDVGGELADAVIAFMADSDEIARLQNEAQEEEPRVGFEILQVISPNEILAWASGQLSQAEFEAIPATPGWVKNQPRESESDSGSFEKSPDAVADGEYTQGQHFGFNWVHVATVIETNISLDDEGLLTGNRVAKFHQLNFDRGRKLAILISPDNERYLRVTRDHGRTSDVPTLPSGWRLIEYVTLQDRTFRLPDETLVIRTDNQDSFQGPLAELNSIGL